MARVRLVLLMALFLIITACSSTNEKGVDPPKTANTANNSLPKGATEPLPLIPVLGEIAVTIPKGWIMNEAGSSKGKDKEIYTFTRYIDQKLWANPGPLGTSTLPVMSMTVTLRDAKASRSDLEPQRLGNSLVKQKVFTELVKAGELRIANLTATEVVGDTIERGRTTIIMMPHNGYLYKWTLDGTKPDAQDVNIDFELMLASANLKK